MKFPTDIHFELTYACNLFCKHCYNHYRHNNPEPTQLENLSREHFLSLTQKIVDSQVFKTILTGGEPFLRRDVLYDVINALNKGNVHVSINSNLTSINDEDVQELKNHNIHGILTSLHSYDPEKHDKITCVQGSHIRTVKNIKKLKENTPICVSSNMVVSKENLHDVYKTGLFLKEQGIEYFTLTPMATCSSAKIKHQDLKLSKKDLTTCLDQMLELEEKSIITPSLNITLSKCFYLINEKYTQFVNKNCSGGLTSLAVNPYGSVKTCIMAEKGILLREGNIIDAFKKIKEERCNVPKFCSNCAEADFCRGGCKGYMTRPDAKSDYTIKVLDKKISNPSSHNPASEYRIMSNLTYRKEEGLVYSIFNFRAPVFFFESELSLIKKLSKLNKFNIHFLEEILKPLKEDDKRLLIKKIVAISKKVREDKMVEKLESLTEKENDTKETIKKIGKTYENETLKEDMVKVTEGLPFAKAYEKKKSNGEEIIDYSPCVNEPPCFGG